MKKILLTNLLLLTVLMTAHAEERTIDISGNNTSSDYKSYSTSISLPASDMAAFLVAVVIMQRFKFQNAARDNVANVQ